MTRPGLASPLSLKTFPPSSACFRKDKSAPTAYSAAFRAAACESRSENKRAKLRAFFMSFPRPPLSASMNRSDLPLLRQYGGTLWLLHGKPGLCAHSAIHVQRQSAGAIEKHKVAIANRHDIPLL